MFALKFPVPSPRRADQTRLPALLAVLLLVLLGVQLALPPQIDLPEVGVGRPFRLAPISVTPLGADPEITARTLFSPSRRPDGAVAAGDKTAPLGGARPVGAVSVRGRARVFMQDPDGKVRGIELGDSIAGWRLAQVSGGQLLFVRGPESITLPIGASAPPVRTGARPTDETEEPEEETQ